MTAFTPIMVVILNDVQDEISLDLLTAVHTDLCLQLIPDKS